jgi:hypothetical protein
MMLMLSLAGSVPTFDVEPTCRAAQSAALAGDGAKVFDSCISSERAARQRLKLAWGRIPAGDRASCSEESAIVSPSYVELLTCVELRGGGNFSGGVPVAK